MLLFRTAVLVALLSAFFTSQAAQPPPRAVELLQRFRQVTGGAAWDQNGDCLSEATLEVNHQTGTLRLEENLRTGDNRAAVHIPSFNVSQVSGNFENMNWEQNGDGDVQLSSADTPVSVDDRYLTGHGYWQPDFGGATVTVLPPQTDSGSTWDRLQFAVPGGHGFTLWLNRNTGLLDKVEGNGTKLFSDYRAVNGVRLPFAETRPGGGADVLVTYTSRSLRSKVDAAFSVPPFRHDYKMPASRTITLPAQGGSSIKGRINGKGPYKILFDTGSVNFMSAAMARTLGLKLDDTVTQIGTSTAASLGVRKALVKTLTLGDLVLYNQTFEVAPATPVADNTPALVVGYELLRRFAVKIDYQHQQITFYDGPYYQYTGPGEPVPIYIDGTMLEADAAIGESSGRFLLDTGNQFGFTVNGGFTREHNLVAASQAHFSGYNGRGYAGPSPDAYLARIHSLRLGKTELPEVIAHLSTGPAVAGELAGNLGESVLDRFTDVFDCMRGRLYLEKTSATAQPETFNRAGLILDTTARGLAVMTVLPGSPASLAGVKVGDYLVRINGRSPGDSPNAPQFLGSAGTPIRLRISRNGRQVDLHLVLADLL